MHSEKDKIDAQVSSERPTVIPKRTNKKPSEQNLQLISLLEANIHSEKDNGDAQAKLGKDKHHSEKDKSESFRVHFRRTMILAFGNKARHGKDTACEAIKDFYARRRNQFYGHGLLPKIQDVRRVNFADELRREVTRAIDRAGSVHKLLSARIDGHILPEWVVADPSPDMGDPLLPHGKHPKLLQWWGTEYRRNEDPDYWVKKWFEQIDNFKGTVVTGDLRFLNEAKAVQYIGGKTINVTRLNVDGSKYYSSDRPMDHISEVELDGHNWDYYITCKTGQTALLGEQAITIAEHLRGLEDK